MTRTDAHDRRSPADEGDALPSVDVVDALPFDETISRRARALVRRHAGPYLSDAVVRDVEVLVSELAENAYLHGGRPVVLHVHTDAAGVRIEVHDGSPDEPHLREPGNGGWGLRIVGRLTDRWGVTPTARGKVVWGEIGTRTRDAA